MITSRDPATLPELLEAWCDEQPGDIVAVERHGRRRTLTVGALVARAERLAAGLAAAGASADRPIVGWLPNRLEWVELIAAAGRLGVPIVGLNTRYRSDELRHVLERSAAGVLVAVDEFAGIRFGAVAAEAGRAGLVSVVVVDSPADPCWADLGCPVIPWSGLADEGSVSHVPAPDDLLIAFTTSGTTGFPKLAVHDQAGVVRHAADDAVAFDVRPGDRLLLDLPLCGTFGFSSLLAAIGGRATTLIDERFDPHDAARAIAEEGITHYNASDDMMLRVFDTGLVRAGRARLARRRVGQLHQRRAHRGRAGGTARHPPHRRLRHVRGLRPPRPLAARRWTCRAVPFRRHPGRSQRGAGDRPRQWRVLATASTASCASADRSSCVATSATTRRPPPRSRPTAGSGVGDLGRLTGDGGFEFLARLGDSLRLRGFLVDPAEIEHRLEKHPAVELAQVVAAERPGRGQVAVAFVRLSRPVTRRTCARHCAAGIADFKVPSGSSRSTSSRPSTARTASRSSSATCA